MATVAASRLETLRERAESQARRLALQESAHRQEGKASPVVLFVDELLLEAGRRGASDIHILPGESAAAAALLVAGHFQPACSLSPELYTLVRARLKLMAGLNLVETRRPQDGLLYQGVPEGLAGWTARFRTLPTINSWEILIVGLRRAPLPFKPPLSAA